jgi:hypothetical protein
VPTQVPSVLPLLTPILAKGAPIGLGRARNRTGLPIVAQGLPIDPSLLAVVSKGLAVLTPLGRLSIRRRARRAGHAQQQQHRCRDGLQVQSHPCPPRCSAGRPTRFVGLASARCLFGPSPELVG